MTNLRITRCGKVSEINFLLPCDRFIGGTFLRKHMLKRTELRAVFAQVNIRKSRNFLSLRQCRNGLKKKLLK